MSAQTIVIEREDPRAEDNAALVDALNALMIELYRPDMCHLLDVDTLAAAEVDFLVARVNGRALACGALVPLGDGTAEIKRMWTAPDGRRRGLARSILHRLEARARDRGFAALRLETGVRQPEALGLYRAEGYVERGAFAGYPEDPEHLFMEKRLDATRSQA